MKRSCGIAAQEAIIAISLKSAPNGDLRDADRKISVNIGLRGT